MPDLCMDVARARAVSHAVDPISFEDLRLRPTQVGALTCHGLRMEPALYHRSSVLDAEGRLRVAGHRSPTTHLPVDGFSPLPPLGEAAALAEFVDWDHDGLVTLAEVLAGCVSEGPRSTSSLPEAGFGIDPESAKDPKIKVVCVCSSPL